MGRRREGREAALQILYQMELSRQPPEECLCSYWETRQEPAPEVREFAEAIALRAVEACDTIDGLIDTAASNWQLDRIARLDLSLLRVAVCELLYFPETPVAVVIDEAVEIARRFSDEKAPSFVNGLLDHIARQRGLIEQD